MLTIAWVVSWMVIETRFFDRRQDGRKAVANELIARCHREITDQDNAYEGQASASTS